MVSSERFSSVVVTLIAEPSNVLDGLLKTSESVSTSRDKVGLSTPGSPNRRGSSLEELKMSTSPSSPSLLAESGDMKCRGFIIYLPPRPILRLAKPTHLRSGIAMEVRQYLYRLSASPPSSRLHQGQLPRPPDNG
ncbi:hypothetical protein C0J52_10718 [Blattella germanica]|nr:hypothetical protein C0J52_10718 [Blattella germanica]